MKTLLHTTALIAIITVIFTANSFASEVNFKDEAYIDDIPFNTEIVFNEVMNPEFDFEDETYINDIPFNTEKLVKEYVYAKAITTEFKMIDETYIDDIPFCTYAVVSTYKNTDKTELIVSVK